MSARAIDRWNIENIPDIVIFVNTEYLTVTRTGLHEYNVATNSLNSLAANRQDASDTLNQPIDESQDCEGDEDVREQEK